MTRDVSPDSVGSRRIIAALLAAAEPLDLTQIAERAHLARGTVKAYRYALIAAGMMHIADYRKPSRGDPIPLYAAGPGLGEPPRKPPPRWESESERNRHYNERVRNPRRRFLQAQADGKGMLATLLSL